MKLPLLTTLACCTILVQAQQLIVETKDGKQHAFPKKEIRDLRFFTHMQTETDTLVQTQTLTEYLSENPHYRTAHHLFEDCGLMHYPLDNEDASVTLILADDEAFNRFFAANPWNVTSYEALSDWQKRQLVAGMLIEHPLPSDSLLYLPGNKIRTNIRTGISDKYSPAVFSLRRPTTTELTAAYPTADSLQTRHIWLSEYNRTRLPIWTSDLVNRKGLTEEDFTHLVHSPGQNGLYGSYLNGTSLLPQLVRCSNGIIYQAAEATIAPTDMATVLRQDGRFGLFSYILDLFSTLRYDQDATESARKNDLIADSDSVFVKRYYSELNADGVPFNQTPDGTPVFYQLPFDPSWSDFHQPGIMPEELNATLFAPTDQAIEQYLLPGGRGAYLIDSYAQKENNRENLLENIATIPKTILNAYVINYMKTGMFVPSTLENIQTIAYNPLFPAGKPWAYAESPLAASNGLVYPLRTVIAPDAYNTALGIAATAPNMNIFQWALHADDRAITNPSNAPLHTYAAQKLSDQHDSFITFIPTNEALSRYYDPISHSLPSSVAWRIFKFAEPTRGNIATTGPDCQSFTYDPVTGQMGSRGTTVTSAARNNRLADILNSHIIRLKPGNGVPKPGFYETLGGSIVWFDGSSIQGGWQIDHRASIGIQKAYKTGNEPVNYTYTIHTLLQPTIQSVYARLHADAEESPYKLFAELLEMDRGLLDDIGIGKDLTPEEREKELNRHMLFTNRNTCVDLNVALYTPDTHYTLYVPSNKAMEQAIADGLPTLTDIVALIAERDVKLTAAEEEKKAEIRQNYNAKARRMLACIQQFIKYHFQHTQVPVNGQQPGGTYTSLCPDETLSRFVPLQVNVNEATGISVTDRNGRTCHVITPQSNVFARDMYLDGNSLERATRINNSSYTTIHVIDQYLNPFDTENGRKTFRDFYEQGNE